MTSPYHCRPDNINSHDMFWSHTLFLSQAAVIDEVEIGASRKVFDLRLSELGPYNIDFSRSGRYMLIGGQKGHLGLMDWQSGHTFCEVQVHAAQATSHAVLASNSMPLCRLFRPGASSIQHHRQSALALPTLDSCVLQFESIKRQCAIKPAVLSG